ncbi:glycosyltransferase [Microbacterium sp. 22303]|uniref:glycosyltransferase n=1 Tax=Microbacterium sp. 22303 TaxID=3453905 RepID=UPI003F82995E
MTSGQGWSPIHRLVLPSDGQPADVLPLYFDADGEIEAVARGSLRVAPGVRLTSGTYFGALPTAVWLARTDVRRVRLRMGLSGEARVRLRATNGAGEARTVSAAEQEGTWEVALDERCAGWLWFELDAVAEVVVTDAVWEAAAPTRPPQTASVAITTHNRVTDCLEVLRTLAEDRALSDRIRTVFVTDQGTQRIQQDPGFPEISARWGDRLVVREQRNLGGSGGFSRGMIEAAGTDATHVLLLDDDVSVEPESIHRLLDFAAHADGRPLVGAQMLSLTEPTQLYSYGERIDRSRFWWGPVAPELSAVDLGSIRIDRTPALSRAYEVDFNGWWMCLIPLDAVRAVGAALPLFIKWDDAEFALRAGEAGFPTVTLPGAAIWHMPWTGKDDGLDWQSYFQLRNRLIAALIHARGRRRTRLLTAALAQDLNHILCMQYGSTAVRLTALEDLLNGPSTLVQTMEEGPARPARILRNAGQELRSESAGFRIGMPPARPRARAIPARVLQVVLHQLRPVRSTAPLVVTREQGKWWSAGLLDAVFLRSATGNGGFLLQRDRRTARRLARTAVRRYARLWWQWPRLQKTHRAASTGFASMEYWRSVLDGKSREEWT